MFRPLHPWPAIFRTFRSSQGLARPSRRARQRHTLRCPPLEQLEDRAVPSVITLLVTSPADSGDRTLRDAITMADQGSANDSYVIKIVAPKTITLESALPDLSRNITITGSASGKTTVQRDPNAPGFRIFTVDEGETVNISRLTIAEGNAGSGNGGGIDNSGTLTVSNSVFSSDSASFGGSGGGLYNAGTLTVRDSKFTSDSAAFGGALYNDVGGTATVSDSFFTGNTVVPSGGGVLHPPSHGGGIANVGTLTVSDSIFTGNTATNGDGGALYNGSYATVSDSLFAGNSATGDGIHNGYGGGLYNDSGGTATVRGCAFISNSATTLVDDSGGAIYNLGTLQPQPPQQFNIFLKNTPDDVGP